MTEITAEELAKVNSFPRLVGLLRDKLEWPINEEYEFEDVIFEYEPHELGLKAQETATLREIHQLRPLVTGQPWGIFFLSFDDKIMSVTVLRRILRALVVKQRASGQSADRAAWENEDLIFAANFGKSGERELAFVHFSDGAATGDLPVMKVLGWNARDTTLHNLHAADLLAKCLTWPDDQADQNGWRGQWASAFEVGHREVITTSKDLAVRLAALAGDIRARANQLLDAETDKGPMRTMLEAFRKNLIHDLDEDGFADMFAQTICYGLLAASISRLSDDGESVIVADNLEDMVPRTNPFLKELFSSFLHLGGRDKNSALDFDELGVRDVVDMLNRAKMGRVLDDFGNRNPKKDPVIHFYELFLHEYDRDQKVDAGIFYTPPAVVSFIVRGVDEMLRTEFDLPLGLADTTTWAELAARNDKITIPDHVDPNAPFVQILDPATGTGTFLVEVIDQIYKRMVETWKHGGKSAAEIKAAWNAYVPLHLLPRMTAFELKMAAYAIAHMKVGLKLVETGYTFGSDERAHILLTNSLQPPRDLDLDERARQVAFAREAERANAVKQSGCFTVVIGNPPYSKSTTKNPWILGLVNLFKEGLNEKKSDTQREEWKFLRLAGYNIELTGAGIFSYICNNSFLGAPTLRLLRKYITSKFSLIRITNLHGDSNIRETCPDGSKDENVFDIRQGVAVVIAGRAMNALVSEGVEYVDIWGERDRKFEALSSSNLDHRIRITPRDPDFSLLPQAEESDAVLRSSISINDMLPAICGIETKRDHFAIDFDSQALSRRLDEFCSHGGSEEEIKKQFQVHDNDWNVIEAKDLLKRDGWKQFIRPCSVRPFDERSVIYCDFVLARSRGNEMASMRSGNIGIIVTKQTKEDFGVFVADEVITHKYVSAYDRSFIGPLFEITQDEFGTETQNLRVAERYFRAFSEPTRLTYKLSEKGARQQAMGSEYRHRKTDQMGLLDQPWIGRGDLQKDFGPRDLFDWIYAILHAPSYRSRYAKFLKSNFPRIPIPKDRATFAALVLLGRRLVALHLLKPEEEPILKKPDIRFAGTGEARVEKGYPKYRNGKVEINASRWFEDVPKATWEFHVGGYEVCDKWLKDRAEKGDSRKDNHRPGRVLTDEDILHYRRMIVALTETRRIMAEIDTTIAAHGGWPDAFLIASSTAPAQLPALATLPDGRWAWPYSVQPGDRLRYAAQYALWQMDPATEAARIRFAIASLAEPRLLTPLLPDDDRAAWLRLVGPEAQPQVGVTRLRPEVNAAWRAMFETMITSGQLAEQSDGSWSRGQHFSDAGLNSASVDAQRAAFALRAVRMMEVSNLQAAVAPEDNVVWANFGHG